MRSISLRLSTPLLLLAALVGGAGAGSGADDDVDRARRECEGGLSGGVRLEGFWDGWCGRHGMGTKFESHDSYGTMTNNTNAGVKIDLGRRGWFSCEVYYDTEIHPGEGGGQHLIGIFSQSAKQAGPYDPEFDYEKLAGWLRLDFGVREDKLQGVIYQSTGDPATATLRTGSYEFKAWRNWATLDVEWEQFDDRIGLSINGVESEHPIAKGRNPIGNILFVGNMDTNRGERCDGEHDPCGLIGKVRFRNFRWGASRPSESSRAGVAP